LGYRIASPGSVGVWPSLSRRSIAVLTVYIVSFVSTHSERLTFLFCHYADPPTIVRANAGPEKAAAKAQSTIGTEISRMFALQLIQKGTIGSL
jgi:hypothetical protein